MGGLRIAILAALAAVPGIALGVPFCAGGTGVCDSANYTVNGTGWSVAADGGDDAFRLQFDAVGGTLPQSFVIYNGADLTDATLKAQTRSAEDLTANDHADIALILSYTGNSYYLAKISNDVDPDPQTRDSGIFRYSGGVTTTLITAAALFNTNGYLAVEFARSGNVLSLKVGGTQINATDNNPLPAGKAGFGSVNDSAYFDDVELIGEPTPDPDPDPDPDPGPGPGPGPGAGGNGEPNVPAIIDPEEELPLKGCGCGASPPGLTALALLALLGRRRRPS
jgi:MYXO-CTERM domain-containing protein